MANYSVRTYTLQQDSDAIMHIPAWGHSTCCRQQAIYADTHTLRLTCMNFVLDKHQTSHPDHTEAPSTQRKPPLASRLGWEHQLQKATVASPRTKQGIPSQLKLEALPSLDPAESSRDSHTLTLFQQLQSPSGSLACWAGSTASCKQLVASHSCAGQQVQLSFLPLTAT